MSNSHDENKDQSNIVTQHYDTLSAFVHRRIASRQDGEDIVQDIFYRLAKADHLVLPVDEALPWLFRVARNLITDFWRKKKGMLFADTEDDDLCEIVELLLSENAETPEEPGLSRCKSKAINTVKSATCVNSDFLLLKQ